MKSESTQSRYAESNTDRDYCDRHELTRIGIQ